MYDNNIYNDIYIDKKINLIEVLNDMLIYSKEKPYISKDLNDFIELLKFEKLNDINGFDENNLDNARQNNYVWSMTELEDYIYVGTGRNVLLQYLYRVAPNIDLSLDWMPNKIDNSAEIWRYKKDKSLPWQKVYKATKDSGIDGFRFMIKYESFGVKPCLYAATNGGNVQILKSTNGVNWFKLDSKNLKGSTSRAMTIHNGKLYLATVDQESDDISKLYKPLIYSSSDPELYGWDKIKIGIKKNKNPIGYIYGMVSFNGKLYVATSHYEGMQVWRTNKSDPEKDDWTLILDKGAGDKANQVPLSMGVYKEHLYVGATMELSNITSFITPKGCDVIRIDKNDNWQLIVGGEPLIATKPSVGERGKSLSGLMSGFNNPLNVYAWQIKEHDGKLLIGTLDHGITMEPVLEICIKNKELLRYLLEKRGIKVSPEEIIEQLEITIKKLKEIDYPYGFDLYTSKDGINFKPCIYKGLGNKQNYGSRILYVGDENKLYIGTANPYEGCEVWRERKIKLSNYFDDEFFNSDFFCENIECKCD